MIKESNYRDILKIEFQNRKSRNQSYSMRAFAHSIGVGSGALSEILNGKRKLGLNKAKSIAEKLNFNQTEKQIFLDSISNTTAVSLQNKESEKRNLSIEVFEIFTSPNCMSILALADLDDFRLDVEWISLKLAIKNQEVDRALKLMRSVGLLEVVNGVEQICEDFILSPDGIPSRAIKNYHHQMLNKASDALEDQLLEMRDISGISFAMDLDDVDKIKKDIFNFQKRLIKKYSKGKKNVLYHLEMALFCLSNGDL